MESAKKIKVAYVINDVLLGGAQTLVLALAEGLDRSRFTPVVYYLNDYPAERPNIRDRFEAAGIELRYIGAGGKTNIRKAIPLLLQAFRASPPDIIHTHLIDATIAGSIAARLSACKAVIIHEHQTHKLYSRKVRLLYRILRPLVRVTLCFSPVIEKELFGSVCVLDEAPGKLRRRSYTIYNGVDVAKAQKAKADGNRSSIRASLDIPADAFVVTSTARLIPWKGQRTLVESFAQVVTEVPNAHLCLVGEGPLKGELNIRARELGISDNVHLLGARTDVYDILLASDAGSLALTYDQGMKGESVGIAGYEIMAMGLPLVASDYPSAALTVRNGENAILVPPGDQKALAATLIRLAHDPELRERIGQNAARYIERTMNWSRLIPIYERLYSLIP